MAQFNIRKYGLPPPTLLSSPPPPLPQLPPQPPPIPGIRRPKQQKAAEEEMARQAELNTSVPSIGSSNRSAQSVLPENFNPRNLHPNAAAYGREYHEEAMEAFNTNRIKAAKAAKAAGGSSRAQQMVLNALAAAGGGSGSSPSAPESSPPAGTVTSDPGSRAGSATNLFGGISPIYKVNNERKRKSRKSRKTRKTRNRKTQKVKNRRHK